MSASPDTARLAGPQLIHQLFYFLDESDYFALTRLFTPLATWRRQGELLVGTAHITAALETRSTTQRIRHIITNVFVSSESASAASLTAYMTAYRFDDGHRHNGPVRISYPFRVSVVHAHLEVVAGQWLVSALDLQPEFEFPADSGTGEVV